MAAGRAWVLNLDADLELARRAGRPYAPSAAVLTAMKPHVALLAASLLAPEDVLVDEESPRGVAAGLSGRAWCPTARARALLLRAGAEPEPHPSDEVLRNVNGRAFSAALGQTLPDALFSADVDLLFAAVRRAPALAPTWRAKRAHGMAGRGQRRIDPAAVTEDDEAFLRRAAGDGGVQLEPNVEVVRELGLHGMLDLEGTLEAGLVVVQECDERGQWLWTREAGGDEVSAATRAALAGELDRVASGLHAAGYFGPFGIDAFEYRAATGERLLQPRSEINARYSMGFSVGMQGRDRARLVSVSPPR